MTSIVFENRPNVYLPEIPAYMDYFQENFPNFTVVESGALKNYSPHDHDVIWRFLGFDFKRCSSNAILIHEYNSLSVPPFALQKNWIKSKLNIRPSGRVFLLEGFAKELSFNDGVKTCFRDMGVGSCFFNKKGGTKEYDFVYAGSLDRGKIIVDLLDHFAYQLTDASLLVIGAVPDHIFQRYSAFDNLVFTGRVQNNYVPDLISKAHYGLNPMPDVYPLNLQTSTKVLEYCAVGLPVVSTNYSWIRNFAKKRRANFFYTKRSFVDLTLERVSRFKFKVPDVSDCVWSRVLNRSNIKTLISP